jgi:hypothetical protein
MDTDIHTLADLFRQLGLADDTAAIEAFIQSHRPLPGDVALADAPFWSAAQAQFLREEKDDDADWAELIDALAVRLSD